MKFCTGQHKHYCGVDLHAGSLYASIIDEAGVIVKHENAGLVQACSETSVLRLSQNLFFDLRAASIDGSSAKIRYGALLCLATGGLISVGPFL